MTNLTFLTCLLFCDKSKIAEKELLKIITDKTKPMIWEIKAGENTLSISCSSKDAVLKGIAPASKERIPARLESQDNDIMYTSFHSLFGGNYLNNIVWHCDPDAAMIRDPLTIEEGRTIVTAMGLTGQHFE